jgi:hypothetical protein
MNVPTAGQKRFVLVAATGMVGGYGLRHWPDATPPGELPRKKRNATALAMLGIKQLSNVTSAFAPNVYFTFLSWAYLRILVSKLK